MNWLFDVLPSPVTGAMAFAAENTWVLWIALGVSALCFVTYMVLTGDDF